ncbi:EAL domain-containing protein [Mobilitalea sibirica]|uniref:EAL domain-containing protein n=1 Tax=Mobilitalea sibirica TaxID=1462919 RepID=A0A8J7KRS3_9FIRM|nr:EAL domain-containing protein [Mobilitalea sibirica]MBH1939576.1 EAL domain-containing protein [Mobilitalea sibirica]
MKNMSDHKINKQVFSANSTADLLESVFQVAKVGICITNYKGEFIKVNEAYCKIYDYTEEELLGNNFTMILPEHQKDKAKKLHDDFINGNPEISDIWRVKKKNGEMIDVLVTAARFEDKKGFRFKVTTVEDVTKFNEISVKLNLLSEALFNSSEGMIFTENDVKKVIEVNDSYTKITGYGKEDLDKGEGNIIETVMRDASLHLVLTNQLEIDGYWQGDVSTIKKNKEKYVSTLKIVALMDKNQNIKNYIGILNEVTDQVKSKNREEYLLTHNTVTGLMNRSTLQLKIMHMSEGSNFGIMALFYVNIDRFKIINDKYGYLIGNKLLKAFANRLLLYYEKEYISYLGVDKFAIFIQNGLSLQTIMDEAEKLKKNMERNFQIDQLSLKIKCSIGIAIYAQDKKIEELFRNSEEAMLEAKKHGGSKVILFTCDMYKKLMRKQKIIDDIQQALTNGMFLVYQPIWDNNYKEISGVEALIRWKHREFGFISPSEFIAVAEENGMIFSIGEWVLKQACQQIKTWENMGIHTVISINISSQEMEKVGFTDHLLAIIHDYQVSPETLEIEITERSIIRDINKTIDIILKLKNMGIKVDIDDFGTGYSSLNYLRKLPFHKLKIDKTFIDDIVQEDESAMLVKAIIDMGHTLQYKVLAEGVETKEQFDALNRLGCDEIQGYYFSKPLLPQEFEKLWYSDDHKDNYVVLTGEISD